MIRDDRTVDFIGLIVERSIYIPTLLRIAAFVAFAWMFLAGTASPAVGIAGMVLVDISISLATIKYKLVQPGKTP